MARNTGNTETIDETQGDTAAPTETEGDTDTAPPAPETPTNARAEYLATVLVNARSGHPHLYQPHTLDHLHPAVREAVVKEAEELLGELDKIEKDPDSVTHLPLPEPGVGG